MSKNCNTIDLRRAQVNKQYPSIGSDNGLAPNRRQAIIWTNDDPVQRRIYVSVISPSLYLNQCRNIVNWTLGMGWLGLWGFLWWAPSAKRKDHHGVSSGWSSVWHHSNTGLSSTQYEQIPIILGVRPFWLTPFFFRSITFWRVMVKLYFLCWNYSLSSGWHIIAA